MRLWIIMPSEPITDDRAYVFGSLQHVFEDVMVTLVRRDASDSSPPPRPPHAVLNIVSTHSRALLESIGSHAHDAGAALSSPTSAAWRAEDKRTYLEDYADISPPTRIARTLDDVRTAFEEFGGDIVVKDPFGMRGRGTERISSELDLPIASKVAENAVGPTRELIVQPFMHGFAKGDKRIITQRAPDGRIEIIGQIMRRPPPDSWKCNIRAGDWSSRPTSPTTNAPSLSRSPPVAASTTPRWTSPNTKAGCTTSNTTPPSGGSSTTTSAGTHDPSRRSAPSSVTSPRTVVPMTRRHRCRRAFTVTGEAICSRATGRGPSREGGGRSREGTILSPRGSNDSRAPWGSVLALGTPRSGPRSVHWARVRPIDRAANQRRPPR